MASRPSVPPVRGRDVMIPTAEEQQKRDEPAPAKRTQTMTYLPAELVTELERERLALRVEGLTVNRSDLIQAAIELALDGGRDDWLARVRRAVA